MTQAYQDYAQRMVEAAESLGLSAKFDDQISKDVIIDLPHTEIDGYVCTGLQAKMVQVYVGDWRIDVFADNIAHPWVGAPNEPICLGNHIDYIYDHLRSDDYVGAITTIISSLFASSSKRAGAIDICGGCRHPVYDGEDSQRCCHDNCENHLYQHVDITSASIAYDCMVAYKCSECENVSCKSHLISCRSCHENLCIECHQGGMCSSCHEEYSQRREEINARRQELNQVFKAFNEMPGGTSNDKGYALYRAFRNKEMDAETVIAAMEALTRAHAENQEQENNQPEAQQEIPF